MKTQYFAAPLALLALSCSVSPSRADISIGGGTGLPLNPTADVAPRGVVLEGTYFDFGGLSFLGIELTRQKFYGVRAATNLGDRVELTLGVDKLKASDDFGLGLDALGKTGLTGGLKLQVLAPRGEHNVRVAVGANRNRALYRNASYYAVASFDLGKNQLAGAARTLHLGVRRDRFSAEAVGGARGTETSYFGGIELPLTKKGAFALVGEIGTDNNNLGQQGTPYSLSLRYRQPRRGLTASIGSARQGLTPNSGLFAQVGFAFGSR